jgi:gliding motility-associated-like protein
MTIFNRWGEKVFETFDVKDCWDGTYKGTNAMSDSYPYVISYKCYNGKIISKKGITSIIK